MFFWLTTFCFRIVLKEDCLLINFWKKFTVNNIYTKTNIFRVNNENIFLNIFSFFSCKCYFVRSCYCIIFRRFYFSKWPIFLTYLVYLSSQLSSPTFLSSLSLHDEPSLSAPEVIDFSKKDESNICPLHHHLMIRPLFFQHLHFL